MSITKNAHVNEKTHRGQASLHYAAIRGHVQAAQLLISGNANVDEKNKDGQNIHEKDNMMEELQLCPMH